MDFSVLNQLCQINSTSGDENELKMFLMDYASSQSAAWKSKPQIIEGPGFQDNLIMLFGKPTTAFYAHMDSVGFTTRYENQLIAIGSPEPVGKDRLVGNDALGPIECGIKIDKKGNAFHEFGRAIEPGTPLVYKPNFVETGEIIASNSLDNRLGIFALLQLAKVMEHGALVFSTYEEHGGGSAGFLASYLYKKYGIIQSLIVDVTWATEGVHLGNGPVVSLRDAYIPRKKFANRITNLLDSYSLVYQREVEASGGSDGSELQRSPYPIDWCFLGVPVNNAHTSKEEANIFDIIRLVSLLEILAFKL